MAEDNNQQPDFSQLVEALKIQNEEASAAKEQAELTAGLTSALKNENLEIGDAQRKQMEELIESMSSGKLADLEDKKEANKIAADTLALLGEIEKNTEGDKIEIDGFGQSILGVGVVLGAAITQTIKGIILGLGDSIKKGAKFFKGVFKGILKPFVSLFRFILSPFTKLGKMAAGLFKPAIDFFKNIGRAFKAGFGGLKTFRATTGQFAKLGFFGSLGKGLRSGLDLIKNGLTKIKNLGKTISAGAKAFGAAIVGAKGLDIAKPFGVFITNIKRLGKIFLPFKTAGKQMNSIQKFLKPVFQIAKIAGKAFGAFGRVVGRLFFPLTILFGLIDSVSGFIDGFKNQEGNMFQKITAGIIGGIGGLAKGLIGIPLDLLKSGVAWIAEKLGFEGAADWLRSFSFSELIGKLFDGINSIWQGIIEFFGNMFSAEGRKKNMEKLRGMLGGINDFIKKILRVILPDPDADREWYDPRGLVAKAIPDSVYEYAGLDPDTGDVVPTQDIADTIVGDDNQLRGELMDATSRENNSAGDGVTGDVAVVTDNSNNQNIKQGDNVIVHLGNQSSDPNLTPAYS